MKLTQPISVSKLLNLYFDEVDIMSLPVQEGIFRGNGLDKAIENVFHNIKPEMPSKDELLKKTLNKDIISNVDELYTQSKNCFLGFQYFLNNTKSKILNSQIWINNENIMLKGIVDATITYNNQKYIVDWKSKKIFDDYSISNANINKKYEEHKIWSKKYGRNISSFDTFSINQKYKLAEYSLSHFRYCLQVCLYWLLMKKPKDYELLVAYFDSNKQYYLYTFSKSQAEIICNTFLNFANSSNDQHLIINKKIKALDWKKYIQWKKIN